MGLCNFLIFRDLALAQLELNNITANCSYKILPGVRREDEDEDESNTASEKTWSPLLIMKIKGRAG